ncbi:MAG: hypothetical protein AAFO84_15235 [Cyanobacteria bacterium J06598_1]
MTRLSDRAYQTVKKEVDRHYNALPEKQITQDQRVEHMILLARLETLHQKGGRGVTKAQLWEEVCDILPNFDPGVLKQAGRLDLGSPAVGTSLGLGAAGIGVAAVLMTSPTVLDGMGAIARSPSTGDANPTQASRSNHLETFEAAKSFGWQAALKGQNPPHSAQHWGETAALWQQAIAQLDQIPQNDRFYAIAQQKKTFYQRNLQHIQARQVAAQNAVTATVASPQFTKAQSADALSAKAQPTKTQSAKTQPTPTFSVQAEPSNTATQPLAPQPDFIGQAKTYGWQAASAAQNAPHPVEKWAEISKLWQRAIYTLDKIDDQHPQYVEAQQVKADYQYNLVVIRQRYQLEQNANQRFQSLRDSLNELDRTSLSGNYAKRSQMEAIVERLRTIPTGTVAHLEAQQLISATAERLQAMPKPPSTKVAASVENAE